MTIDIYTCFTAKELREALGLARFVISAANREILGDKSGFKYNKDVLENTLKECKEKNVRDKLEYIYRFLTHLAWLSQEVTEQDHLHFKEKTNAKKETNT